jgi:hypothetical protein
MPTKFQAHKDPVWVTFVKWDGEEYCYCRRGCAEIVSRDPRWSEEEYNEVAKLAGMIGCDECEEWYHFACLGLVCGEVDESVAFKCHKCRGLPWPALVEVNLPYSALPLEAAALAGPLSKTSPTPIV